MDGMAFVEFAAVDPQPLARLFEKLGFKRVSEMAGRDITFWRQGGVDIILNADSQTHGGTFAALHGPCISAIAFHVSNAKAAFERAIQMGAVIVTPGGGSVSLLRSVVNAIASDKQRNRWTISVC
jgi:4-hydroxyphenylpyruvate dioxygenase